MSATKNNFLALPPTQIRVLLFALAALVAVAPASAVAQTYFYNFDSGPPTSGTAFPVTEMVVHWESALCSTVMLSNSQVVLTGAGYMVTNVNVCNSSGKGLLTFTMTGPHGETFAGIGVTRPITGPGGYNVDFSFADPPFPSEGQIAEEFENATLTVTDNFALTAEWCEFCALELRLHPGVPIEREIIATVEFRALSGAQIGPAQRVTVGPGQVASVRFQPNQLAGIGNHLDLVPAVTIDNAGLNASQVRVTAEVLDRRSGFGLLLFPDSFSVPAATLGPQSIAAGQIMRLIARATSPNPCVATLGFRNAAGALVGPQAAINLSSGQAQTLDLDAGVLSLGQGQEAVVQPSAQIIPVAANGSICSVTSEVFDARTGRPGTYQNTLLQ